MPHVIVVGAGAGGLATAIDLARRGAAVTLLERAATVGGKIRSVGGVDSGPTVFTMRWVFDALFSDAGTTLESLLTLHPVDVLARHAWSHTERLDLFADMDQSIDAIGRFAGPAEAAGYRDFCARSQRVYRTLEQPFMCAPRPTALSLAGSTGVSAMMGIAPFATLWRALGEHFRDPRLRQLFGRYATYSGSSPFESPATLMLIAHVEQQGVWLVEGGMVRLAQAMRDLAQGLGVTLRTGAQVEEIIVRDRRANGVRLTTGERIEADAVVLNGDVGALAAGLFGRALTNAAPAPKLAERSLSAITWAATATTTGFPLTRHNVFFSRDYPAEFDDIFRRHRLPTAPTVYVCAQDRGLSDPDGAERLLVLTNAPATGDRHDFTASEIEPCTRATFGLLSRCGLQVDLHPTRTEVTTPTQFEHLFPATGGALYGRAVHGSMAAFKRPGSRSAIQGLYLAGGSVHPGPGVPMAVLSGRQAAASVLEDLTSRSRSRRTVTSGGMLMR
jgi:1-hydroxycarotenoid 3,4-desaturase